MVITVNPPAPVVTSSLTASGTVGQAFTYTITASDTPTSFSATPLPAGLSVNTSNGILSGTPTASGTTNVTIGATNAGGTGTATLVITVNPPAPAITSSLTASGTVGQAFTYTITASNTPTSFSATPLPAGLSVNTSNGILSGTPTASGTTNVTIGATNPTGTGTATLVLTVAPAVPRNILIIIADDYGLDASSLYNTSPGVSLAQTPNIASLAASGVKFTHAYTYTVCSPSRSSIMTGRYGFRTGTANVAGGTSSNNALKAAEFTLPEAFAANPSLNYQFKHIGKWHLGGGNVAPINLGGWQSFSGSLGGEIADYYSWPKVVTDGTTTVTSTSATYATTDQVNDAVSFITAHNTGTGDGKPWLTWVAFNAPHVTTGTPFYQKPPAGLLYTQAYKDLSGTNADILANPLNYYNAMIEAMDWEIGRLLASVDLSKTDVIFVGDNGTPPGTLQAPYPANHGKASLYEGGIRVPMIIAGADVVSPNRTSDVLTHFVDLYSTILELAGINVAATVPNGTVLDSQSLVPVLKIPSQTVFRTQVFGDYFDLAFPTLSKSGRTLRDTQYKLIRYNFALAADEFYDLQADPYESTNLFANGYNGASMTAPRQAAYDNLVAQLANYDTPPTITAIANRSTTVGTSTGPIAFTIGDAEEVATNLGVSASSSNTTLVPNANIAIGGTAPNQTVTITPAAAQTGTSTITVSVSDGTFSASSSFVLTAGAPTAISAVATSPAAPTNTDTVSVTANVSPNTASVQLTYSTGAQVTAPAFREIFANPSTASGIAGAMNAWTSTAARAAGDVKLRSGTANHTVPIVLANCTTNGTTAVTCSSTTGLIPGMSISGTNIAANATVSSVTSSTAFVLGTAATGSGSGLSLTAAGVSLTGCSAASGTTINCNTTTGLSVGMGISGAGLVTNPPNTVPVVATIGTTSFTVTIGAGGTVTTCPASLTASGCGLEFSTGSAPYTDTMATTTNAINAASATAGNVEFYVRTADLVSNHGWTFQISPDGGTTWTTRQNESFAAGQLSACTLNSGNDQVNGSTTIGCSNTTGLVAGMSVQGAAVQVAGCVTSSTTTPTIVFTANTGGLAVGMFVNGPAGSGIPANSRVTAINPGVSFTMNNGATVTNASPGINLTANYVAPNATIATVGATSFTLTQAAFYNGTVSLVNHSFMLKHYDLIAGDMTASMKMRFQWSGSTAAAPARPPTCDIDDVIVTLTTGAAPGTLTMFDDGAHGDGGAGDGIYGTGTQAGQFIPAQPAGTVVSYTITATDASAGTAASNGTYTVATAAPALTVTPTTGLSSSGAAGSGTYSPAGQAYTLTNSGTGSMSWTAAKTQSWLDLSSTSGALAAGSSTTVTASINAANANSLSANTYNDTITFTNTSIVPTASVTRAASLLITNGNPTAPSAPVIAALPLFSAGTAKTITWPAVATATSYTLQIASSANFTTNLLASQTVAGSSAAFTNLTDGVTYFYRVLATNSIGSSAYSSTVSSTQDTGAPTVTITSPSITTTTATNTITVTGTASDTRSGISGVKVNNVAATSGNNFATWSATIPLGFGGNAITATATDGAGNQTTSAAVIVNMTTFQAYNPLIIPDTITGTTMNLDLYQTNKRFPTWSASNPTLGINPSTTLGPAPGTTTLGYNGAQIWGPTLIMNKGDTVQLNVKNHLDQSNSTLLRSTTTTVHWHGFHIPAIMDGGPRQVIPAGTTWSPTFTVKNDAATFWYHPHLHMATQEQLTLGAGGMIIVHDPVEAALGLPRTYGVDDIPLAVTTRRLLSGNNEFSSNQYVQSDGSTSTRDNYGDYVLVNGTMNPQVSLPQQFVRLRILCADIQRGYRFGFSDNRNFYVIANDQGLLNAPQLVSQVTMMIGERVEILVNLAGDPVNSSVDLVAYDNLGAAGGLAGALGGFGGSESPSTAPTGNVGQENGGLLCNSDFKVLRITVAAPTANPITSVPVTLASNTYWTNADATTTRTINIANGNGGTPGFTFDGIAYSPTTNNFNIPLNAIEKWTFNGGQVFGHSIHIHDIKFKIISRSVTQGGANTNQIFDTISNVASPIGTKACANYESGWKDTLYVPRGESVSVIAKYDDFASPNNPYMLHCHMLNHEDGGLMGQFVVTSAATESLAIASFTRTGTNNLINFQFNATNGTSYLVQHSPDMTTGSWQTIGTVTSDGTAATFIEADVTRLAQPRGFYRAVIQSVLTPPVITSSASATATRGAAFSYQITATNSPTGYGAILLGGNTAAGLPGGLSVNASTGVVSGTVPVGTAAGNYNISVSASNSGGTNHKTVALTVN